MVWVGLDSRFGQTDKIKGFWFALVEFGLVCLLIPQKNKLKHYLILINLISEFVFGYSTDKQTN